MTVAMPPLLQSVQLKSYLSGNTNPNYIDESDDESDDERSASYLSWLPYMSVAGYSLDINNPVAISSTYDQVTK